MKEAKQAKCDLENEEFKEEKFQDIFENCYIHIPGDFNYFNFMIDIYQDYEKISEFTRRKIKQNQIDK